MKVSYEGMGDVIATFCAQEGSTIEPGNAVCLTGSDTVGLGTAGTVPCGVAATVAGDGYVGVQIAGLARVPYVGTTAPTAGWNSLAGDGKGSFQVVETKGHPFLVLSVDSAAGTMVVKL